MHIFTSGTDVKKLRIKNLKVTLHQKFCSSSLSSDLGLCSRTAPTLILTRHALISMVRKKQVEKHEER